MDVPKPRLTLMVDKANMRVIYAECDRFMVDVLFSFLTTPVAALVRRTGKSSGLPCMDSLYQCVEDMPADLFNTPHCQQMLLRPRSAHGFAHHRLMLSVNDVDEVFYVCPTGKCPRFSLFPGVDCQCGRGLTEIKKLKLPPPAGSDAVFICSSVGAAAFVVTDDLFIAPSTDLIKDELRSLAGVASAENLEQRIVLVNDEQITQLMKMSLQSNTPISDTFLTTVLPPKPIHRPLKFMEQHLTVNKENSWRCMEKLGKFLLNMIAYILEPKKKLAITLFHDQDRVLYAKVDKSFADIILSFLTLPFGSIVAAFDEISFLKCIHNLHHAVKKFRSHCLFYQDSNEPEIASYILNPPVALHHTSCSQLLEIGSEPFPLTIRKCRFCDGLDEMCEFKWHTACSLAAINPKFEGGRITAEGGGYMKPQKTFIITNALVVKPNYDLSNDHNATGLVEKTVLVGREEVLELLMASLVLEDPLTSVFLLADEENCEEKKA